MNIYQRAVRILFLCTAGFLLFMSCTDSVPVWHTGLDEALASAQVRNKNIFLLFTGFNWDTVSSGLMTSIFDTDEFKREAGRNYVLLHIDIPDRASSEDTEKAAEIYRLAVNMGTRAAPTALLVTKTGRPFAFLPMTVNTKTPEDMLALIRAEHGRGKKVNSLYEKMEKAEGAKKARFTDAYIEAIPERFHGTLTDLFLDIIDSDPENKSGLLGKYKLRIASEKAAQAFHSGHFDGELNEFLILINEKGLLSPLQIQDAYYQLAYFSVNSGKIAKEEAVTYLRQAYNAAPESTAAADILHVIESLTDSGSRQQNITDAASGGTQEAGK